MKPARPSVVDHLAVQEPVAPLGVDPVASLDLAVQPRGAGADADVVDAPVQQVPVERGTELLAACLHALDGEGELGQG